MRALQSTSMGNHTEGNEKETCFIIPMFSSVLPLTDGCYTRNPDLAMYTCHDFGGVRDSEYSVKNK